MLPEPHSHLRLFEQELERHLEQKALERAARAAARERTGGGPRRPDSAVASAELRARLRAFLVALAAGIR